MQFSYVADQLPRFTEVDHNKVEALFPKIQVIMHSSQCQFVDRNLVSTETVDEVRGRAGGPVRRQHREVCPDGCALDGVHGVDALPMAVVKHARSRSLDWNVVNTCSCYKCSRRLAVDSGPYGAHQLCAADDAHG